MRLSKLIFCLVFLPCLAFADSNYYLGASGVPAATGDACGTDNLIFSSHFEGTGNSTTAFDVTTGTPCGCSLDASKDITYFGTAANSTTEAIDDVYSFFRSATTAYATFPVTGIAVDEGISVEFNFKYKAGSWDANGIIIKVSDADSTDYVSIQLYGTDELIIRMYVNGDLTGSAITSGFDIAADTKYLIRARIRHGTTDPWMEATIDGAADFVDNDDPGNFNDVPTFGQLGSSSIYGHDMAVDEFKIYDVWKTGDEWGD